MRLALTSLVVTAGLAIAPAFAQTSTSPTMPSTPSVPSTSATGSPSSTATPNSGTTTSPLVNVNLQNVRAEIANNAHINVSQVPVTIQVPVDVAANICGLNVSALAGQGGSGGQPSCSATNAPMAMQYVQNNIQ